MSMTDKIPPQLIGLSGTLGSGKDTIANHLVQKHNFLHVSTGDVLRHEAAKRGLPTDRRTLIDISIQMRKSGRGFGLFIEEGIKLFNKQKHTYAGLVMSGLRVPGEAEYIQQIGGKLLFIDAPVQERYRRVISRQRDNEPTKTLQQFIDYDTDEINGVSDDPYEVNLGAIRKKADTVITNTGSFEELFDQVEKVLNQQY